MAKIKRVVIVSNKHKVVTSDPSRLSGMTAVEIQRHLSYGNAITYSVVKNYNNRCFRFQLVGSGY